MRKTCVAFALLLILPSLITCLADASALLPTPKPETEPAPVSVVLPNFGSFSGESGELTAEGFAYEDSIWNVYYFHQTENWGNEVNEWIAACKDRGFAMTMDKFEGVTGYRMEQDGLCAILIPGLNDQIMLMTQVGLEMEAFALSEETPIQKGEMRIVYNGKKYNWHYYFVYRSAYFPRFEVNASDVNTELGKLEIWIPSRVETGTHDHYTSKSGISNSQYGLLIKNGSIPLFCGENVLPDDRMESDKDYFDATIYYRDEHEVYGLYEGSFNNGADVISVEFYVNLDDA